MGAPKQKWTQEEEAALRAGVNKHGTGKWSNIQKDPEFNPYLSSRSNIDLKDKWRNMCVSAGGQGSREKVRIPKLKALPAIPSSSSQRPASPAQVKQDGPSTHRPASPVQVKQDGSSTHRTASPAQVNQDGPSTHRTASHAQIKHDGPSTHRTASPAQVKQDGPSTHKVSLKSLQDGKTPRCSAGMIIEALTEMHEPSGVEIGAMCSYIEQKHEVSLNRRLLTSKLRRLVQLNKIEKVQKGFKLKETSIATSTPSPEQKDPPHSMKLPQQSEIEELAANVAYKVADWDAKSFLASEAVKEAERIERMEEETDCLLTIAREIFEQCSRGQIITMA